MALSDPQGLLASPLTILLRSHEEADIGAILDIVQRHQAGRIIIGLPRMMNGNPSRQTAKVESFVQSLRAHTSLPIELRDERLTTISAQRLMREAGNKKPTRKHDDAIAAAIILQGYLDESLS